MQPPTVTRPPLHTVLRRIAWRVASPGRQPLPIGPLLSPLRYDVLVRMRAFEFVARHADLAETDFPALVRLAREHPYHVWYTNVALPRHRPRIAADAALRQTYFERRMRLTVRLWRGFRRRGYDTRFPVVLRPLAAPATTATGKTVRERYALTDGCHRLALLLTAGATVLEPGQYVVAPGPVRVPVDNTALLLRALRVPETDYAPFLSLGYADRRFEDIASLVRHVAATAPERLTDLLGVLAADAPALDFPCPPAPRW